MIQPASSKNMPPSLELYDVPLGGLLQSLERNGYEGLTAEQRLEVIESATVEDYCWAMTIFHQKLAPGTSESPHEYSLFVTRPGWEKGQVILTEAARPEDRYAIMQYALYSAKRLVLMYRESGGSIQNVLDRCGNLAAMGALLAHSFEDGNGRPARVLAHLVRYGHHADDLFGAQVLRLLGKKRQRVSGEFVIDSYTPLVRWADGAPLRFLDEVAAFDVPFDDEAYRERVGRILTTPYEPTQAQWWPS